MLPGMLHVVVKSPQWEKGLVNMINDGRGFMTNSFFSGGAGMFFQYHDIIKPTYFYLIIQMMITKATYGLPIDIIGDMSVLSLVEWYMHRRYQNPLRCLDYANQINPEELDELAKKILINDGSIYKYAPTLNTVRLLNVYRKQQMTFPVFVYNEDDDPNMRTDIKTLFSGVQHKFLHGDLKAAISKCDNNFTYIFSDIELVKQSAEILRGTCSHVLLARDYRYNYIDYFRNFKYNLQTDIMDKYPFVRTSTTLAVTKDNLVRSFIDLKNLDERN